MRAWHAQPVASCGRLPMAGCAASAAKPEAIARATCLVKRVVPAAKTGTTTRMRPRRASHGRSAGRGRRCPPWARPRRTGAATRARPASPRSPTWACARPGLPALQDPSCWLLAHPSPIDAVQPAWVDSPSRRTLRCARRGVSVRPPNTWSAPERRAQIARAPLAPLAARPPSPTRRGVIRWACVQRAANLTASWGARRVSLGRSAPATPPPRRVERRTSGGTTTETPAPRAPHGPSVARETSWLRSARQPPIVAARRAPRGSPSRPTAPCAHPGCPVRQGRR